MLKRIVSFLLMLSLSLCLIPQAFALPNTDVSYEEGINDALTAFNVEVKGIADYLPMISLGQCTPEDFQFNLNYYNSTFPDAVKQALIRGSFSGQLERFLDSHMKCTPKYDDSSGVYRIWVSSANAWFSNSSGQYPYCAKDDWEAYLNGGTVGNTAAAWTSKSGHFVDTTNIDTTNLVVVSKEVLDSLHKELVENGETCSLVKSNFNGVVYWTILKSSGTRGAMFCNKSNRPIVASYEPAMADQELNYNTQITVDQSDNSTTENTIDLSKVWDMTNGQFYFINENGDKITQNIDSINYNVDNSTYTVNTYDYTYNTTNNYFEFNYYTYNIQYTYNNTYVTYIGSTAEYQPTEYRLYYELPDGRSSADLTEADIAGLSFQFHDVLNYKRSATDVSLRALYHFDGDTEDSSYFSTEDSFAWKSGASITYMESNAFNGALYLDEKAHSFTLTLPSGIGSRDFTLQWRYYQNSATTSENSDNWLSIGGKRLLSWSEQYLYALGTNRVGNLSVGTWQELALVRDGGTLYYYHNGLKIGSTDLADALSNQIVFNFGPSSRAYSMFDELRVVNFAVAKGGASYTPTVVPYDTNSVLVLPDSADPVADEYWSLVTDGNLLPRSDFTYYQSDHSNYVTAGDVSVAFGSSSVIVSNSGSYRLLSEITNSTLLAGGGVGYSDGTSDVLSAFKLQLCRFTSKTATSTFLYALDSGTKYVFSILGADGTLYSLPITTPSRNLASFVSSPVTEIEFDWGYIGYACALMGMNTGGFNEQVHTIFVVPKTGTDFEFVYCELVEGDTPNTGHELVTAIYDKTELQANTAAIQSDIPVNGYTVGGVRPTFPVRGDVWFPVEGNRISGVYIYNGRAWEETNARWWTGSRWIPIYAFDIVTLQDMWDVVGSDGEKLESTITSEYSFWNWWQKSWNAFTDKLFGVLGSSSGNGSGGGSGSSEIPDGAFSEDDTTDNWSVIDLVVALKDGTWKIVTGTVKVAFGGVAGIVSSVVSIGDFFGAVGDLSDQMQEGITWTS